MILAMKLANRNKKNEIETYPKDKLKAKTSRNFDYLEKSFLKKKFPFMVEITPKEKNNKNLNTISKDYMKKHHSVSLYGKLFKIPKK